MEMRQRLLRFILDMFGYIYISIEDCKKSRKAKQKPEKEDKDKEDE